MKKAQPENPHTPIPTTEAHARDHNARYRRLDEYGREIVSPLPLEPPLGYKKTESMSQLVHRMVHDEMIRRELASQGIETFEESDDFDVGDDYEPNSPWENEFDPPISELTKAGKQELDKKQQASNQPPHSAPTAPVGAPPKAENPPATKEISGGAEGGSPKA